MPELLSFVAQSSIFAKLILFVLVAMSFATWYVMGLKWWEFGQVRKYTNAFGQVIAAGGWSQVQGELHTRMRNAALRSPQYQLFSAAQIAVSKLKQQSPAPDSVEIQSVVRRTMAFHQDKLQRRFERFLPFLATAATTAPYIGLLGTVIGVMTAFLGLSSGGNNTLVSVAPGIAESLIATAMGLVVAIPALMVYNFFVNRANELGDDLGSFIEEWAARID